MSARIGIVGTGNIFSIYAQNLTRFAGVKVVCACDLDPAKAAAACAPFGISVEAGVDAILARTDLDTVLVLTPPEGHYDVVRDALNAGKHVYVEKPLAFTVQQGRELVDLANTKGLKLGCAPDTVLGAGIQTCRKLIEDGAIGRPLFAQAFMLCRGHESWHPSPEFYYQRGGGPMFDMGPYYLSALITLLGPLAQVCGMVAAGFAERTITSQPLSGKVIHPEVPTHVMGHLQFASGAVGAIVTTFDVYPHPYPHILVFGTEGNIEVPDPNGFGGTIRLSKRGGPYEDVALAFPHAENSRGLGVVDMLQSDAPRASGEVALHVLEIMEGLHQGSPVSLGTLERPKAMPVEGYPYRS